MPSDEINQPSFSDFLATEDSQEPTSEVQPEAPTEPAVPTPVEQETVEDVQQPEPVASQELPAPSQPEQVSFEGYLRDSGYDIPDDVDPGELYSRAADEIRANREAQAELSRLRAELEKAQSAPAPAPVAPVPVDTAPEPPPVSETPAEKGERLFQELKEYDPNLRNYVEFDENGRATPKTDFGPVAFEAAAQINAYEQEAARQAKLIMKNPNAIIDANEDRIAQLAAEKAESLFEERFAAYKAENEKQLAEQQAAAAEAAQEQRRVEWHETNKNKFFKLGPTGEPLLDPFDPNQYVMTPLGNKFREVFADLSGRLQGVNQLEVMQLALEKAELLQPAAAPEPAAPRTQLEQKKTFVEQRQPTVPHQNHTPASVEDVHQAFPNMRFSDMVMNDPENEEIVTSW